MVRDVEGFPRMYHNPNSTVKVTFADRDTNGAQFTLQFRLKSETASSVRVEGHTEEGRVRNIDFDKSFVVKYAIDDDDGGGRVMQTPEEHGVWFDEWQELVL